MFEVPSRSFREAGDPSGIERLCCAGRPVPHVVEHRSHRQKRIRAVYAALGICDGSASRSRSKVIDRTACHTMYPNTLMRSHTPSQGVGRLAATRGASQKVNAPKMKRIAIVAME